MCTVVGRMTSGDDAVLFMQTKAEEAKKRVQFKFTSPRDQSPLTRVWLFPFSPSLSDECV